MRDFKLVYIAGYGRSGSTLLDILLGSHPEFFGAGELTHIFRELEVNALCSCGMKYHDCPFWSGVMRMVRAELGEVDFLKLDDATKKAEKLGLRTGQNEPTELYCTAWHCLFNAIYKGNNTNAKVIVDSSKSTWKTWNRILKLKRCGFDIAGLHLVRNPMAVMHSISKGSNRLIEKGQEAHLAGGMLRGLLGWILSNVLAELAKAIGPVDFLQVRYEDLTRNPARELNRIGSFLAMDMSPVIARINSGENFTSGHGTLGNRMRRQGPIKIKEDARWHRHLPIHGKLLALISWPIAVRYGYKLF